MVGVYRKPTRSDWIQALILLVLRHRNARYRSDADCDPTDRSSGDRT